MELSSLLQAHAALSQEQPTGTYCMGGRIRAKIALDPSEKKRILSLSRIEPKFLRLSSP